MADFVQRRRHSKPEWARHEAKIRKIFMDENQSLAVVMRTMAREDGFHASKSQYETQLKAWNMTKNHKRGDWKAISHHLRHRQDLGKQTEVLFNGRILPDRTIQRALAEHRASLQRQLNDPCPPLPSGFRMRTPPLEQMKHLQAISSDMPTEQLLRSFDSRIPLFASEVGPSYVTPTDLSRPDKSSEYPLNYIPMADVQILHARPRTMFTVESQHSTLQALLPPSLLRYISTRAQAPVQIQDTSTAMTAIRFMDSPYFKLMVFGLANNFIGMAGISLEAVWDFLSIEAGARIIPFLRLFHRHTARAVIEKLLQCVIEAGDIQGVELLLSIAEYPINLNEAVCRDYWRDKRTPLELAAMCRHKKIIEILLRYGADANKSFSQYTWHHEAKAELRRRTRNPEDASFADVHPEAKGPLACALGRHRFQPRSADFEPELADIVRILIDAGASVDPRVIDYGLVKTQAIFWQLIHASTAEDHARCFYRGVLHDCLKFLDSDTATDVFKTVFYHPLLDPLMNEEHEPIDTRDRLIDRAASRGNLELVQFLLSTGRFSLTRDTLSHAIRSGDTETVLFLLAQGTSIAMCTSWNTTPYSEALLHQDPYIIQLLEQAGALKHMDQLRHCVPALEVCYKTQDFEAADRLFGLAGPLTPTPLTSGLVAAIYVGVDSMVSRLIEAGADVDREIYWEAADKRGPVLSHALAQRSEHAVRELLKSPDITLDQEKFLTDAVEWGNISIIQEMILAGAPINPPWVSPLAAAVKGGNKHVIDLLLRFGASIYVEVPESRRSHLGQTPLSVAATQGDLPLVSFLLSLGADPADYDALRAATLSGTKDLKELMFSQFRQRYPRGRGSFGLELIQKAILDENVALVQELVSNKLGSQTIFGARKQQWSSIRGEVHVRLGTPLVCAIEAENESSLQIIRILLGEDFDLNAVVQRIEVPLAADSGHIISQAETALLAAIGAKQLDKVRFFVERGADINAPPTRGIKRTALQRAAEIGHFGIVEYLINLGADVNAPAAGVGGATALQFAAIHGYLGISNLLLQHGANPNAAPARREGRTALEGAAEHGRLDTVKLLLMSGAKTDGGYREQFDRAVENAETNGHFAVADLLRSWESNGRETQVLELTGVGENEDFSGRYMDDFICWDTLPYGSNLLEGGA